MNETRWCRICKSLQLTDVEVMIHNVIMTCHKLQDCLYFAKIC